MHLYVRAQVRCRPGTFPLHVGLVYEKEPGSTTFQPVVPDSLFRPQLKNQAAAGLYFL